MYMYIYIYILIFVVARLLFSPLSLVKCACVHACLAAGRDSGPLGPRPDWGRAHCAGVIGKKVVLFCFCCWYLFVMCLFLCTYVVYLFVLLVLFGQRGRKAHRYAHWGTETGGQVLRFWAVPQQYTYIYIYIYIYIYMCLFTYNSVRAVSVFVILISVMILKYGRYCY